MNFITKQVEKKIGMDLNGDGVIGSGRGQQHGNAGGYSQGSGGAGGLMNKLEGAIGMDLNGDGRIGGGGGMSHGQQYNQQGGYPPNYNQQGGGYPPNYNQYGGQGYPPQNNQYGGPGPQNYGQYGGSGYGQNPHQSGGGGGGGMMSKLEGAIGMDLNGDGRIGGGSGYPPNNQYGHQ